jgi:hypothetical protein
MRRRYDRHTRQQQEEGVLTSLYLPLSPFTLSHPNVGAHYDAMNVGTQWLATFKRSADDMVGHLMIYDLNGFMKCVSV